MRDHVIKSGALVASVVAVLEKHHSGIRKEHFSRNSSTGLIRPIKTDAGANTSMGATSDKNKQDTSVVKTQEVAAVKNRMTKEEENCNQSKTIKTSSDGNFESAVKAFDFVAQDVAKTFQDEHIKKSQENKAEVVEDIKKNQQNRAEFVVEGENKNQENKAEIVIEDIKKNQENRAEFVVVNVDVNNSDGQEIKINKNSADVLEIKGSEDKVLKNGKEIIEVGLGEVDDDDDDFITALKEDQSTNSTESERLIFDNGKLKVVGGAFDYDSDSLEDHTTSDSEGEHLVNGGLETITEEDRLSEGSILSFTGCEDGDDSSLEDEDRLTPKNHHQRNWSSPGHGSGSVSNHGGSTSDLSSTGSSGDGGRDVRGNGSRRCNKDFQWLSKVPLPSPAPRNSPQTSPPKMEEVHLGKPPIAARSVRDKTPKRSGGDLRTGAAPGSLDRRRHSHKREERDQKSRSSHVKSPPRLEDFQQSPHTPPYQQNGYLLGSPASCGPYDGCAPFDGYHRRPERLEPQRYGSTPMLMEHRYQERGSHPDLYGECGGRFRHEMSCCSSYHLGPPPPCCYYGGADRGGGYHWTPPAPYIKPGEQDEKVRKLQYEKENLQLQVQVLTEQIEAQSDKISDLEKIVHEKKQLLSDSEEKLQREMLSRSSLETQKLELMTIMSELKLNAAALERENIELRRGNYNTDGKKPPFMPRSHSGSQPQLTSTPNQSSQILRVSPSQSPVILAANGTARISTDNFATQDNLRPKTPPSNYKRQIDIQYGSLPRQQFLLNGGGTVSFTTVDNNANPQKKGVAFAETEKVGSEEIDSTKESSPGSPTLSFNKNKGIKKIFGKMKRSGSGNLEDLPPGLGDFTRGGVRATAAARLGWSEPRLNPKPEKPFSEWDTESICDWLEDLGLDQYITEAKRWVKTGQQLQECSMTEIEKELNIKNALHRKKLQLALIDSSENASSDPFLTKAGQLDTAWVLRWLDDAGLPQHKESFLINRVDGRVLHRLTIDDLALLHVTSLIHVASIKRGIQVLRDNDYEPTCLTRRSQPDDPEKSNPNQICLWTTHRVMEWLRAVDLAEYAPNLRGAGVHGGLMVLEPKFTPDLLASLLSIPPNKTLLRRHLNTHFKELVGKDIMQEKRDLEATLGYTPLTPSSKLKAPKKSQFSLKRKKSKGEADYGDLVCPLNPERNSGDMSSHATNLGMTNTKENQEFEDVYRRNEVPRSSQSSKSLPSSVRNSPVTFRQV